MKDGNVSVWRIAGSLVIPASDIPPVPPEERLPEVYKFHASLDGGSLRRRMSYPISNLYRHGDRRAAVDDIRSGIRDTMNIGREARNFLEMGFAKIG